MMSVILAGTVRFDPSKLDQSRPRMKEMIRLSQAEDGCIAYTYSEDLSEPGLIHIFEVWRDEAVDPQYLRVYVSQLRHKIEADPASPRHVLTEPGVGYRLV